MIVQIWRSGETLQTHRTLMRLLPTMNPPVCIQWGRSTKSLATHHTYVWLFSWKIKFLLKKPHPFLHHLNWPVWVRMCRFSSDGLSKALEQTLQGSSVLSLGLALGVGTPASGRSPCELAAELSPDMDFLSSSADCGEAESTRERRDIERSSGESEKISSIRH